MAEHLHWIRQRRKKAGDKRIFAFCISLPLPRTRAISSPNAGLSGHPPQHLRGTGMPPLASQQVTKRCTSNTGCQMGWGLGDQGLQQSLIQFHLLHSYLYMEGAGTRRGNHLWGHFGRFPPGSPSRMQRERELGGWMGSSYLLYRI